MEKRALGLRVRGTTTLVSHTFSFFCQGTYSRAVSARGDWWLDSNVCSNVNRKREKPFVSWSGVLTQRRVMSSGCCRCSQVYL